MLTLLPTTIKAQQFLFLITPTAMIAASVNCNSCDKSFDVTRAAVGRHLINKPS